VHGEIQHSVETRADHQTYDDGYNPLLPLAVSVALPNLLDRAEHVAFRCIPVYVVSISNGIDRLEDAFLYVGSHRFPPAL
jgi:hypothetical protein